MRILTLAIICTLISGCGLFKTKTKEVEESKIESVSESHSKVDIDYSDKSKSVEVNKSDLSEFSINGYYVKGKGIKFNSDGSFTADEAEIKGVLETKRTKTDSTSKKTENNVNIDVKSDEEQKEKEKQSDKVIVTKSGPSGKGIILGCIGFLIVVFGLLWYLGIKRK